mmetsp:Transcript_17043/g.38513  ORF Transcript_17043/g.38513 Transcript_17043/m.38513 type:complete len:223 (+) Transcript_17043:176-844(+)
MLLLLEVHLVLPELIHEGVDLVAQLPEVCCAGLVLLLHPRVVLLCLLQGLAQGADSLFQRGLAALHLRLALSPLVRVLGVHLQLHRDALLLDGELVEGLPQALDGLLHPVGVHLVVLDRLEVLDVRVLGISQLLLQLGYVHLRLGGEVRLGLPQLVRLALGVAELLLELRDLGVGARQLLVAGLLDLVVLVGDPLEAVLLVGEVLGIGLALLGDLLFCLQHI